MGQGETRTEVFTVYSQDGTSHDITVVVTGVNDAAVITGNDAGAAKVQYLGQGETRTEVFTVYSQDGTPAR
ncbi:VCBS domain-containing protein [Chromobacterium piscinae]|uniref:VCBS domain-containing protein n=1 Tax=Chromobacterium piscinae TaxID=686831 RepID=UPI0031FDC156